MKIMRYLITMLLSTAFISSYSQDQIHGLWLTGEGQTKVEISENSQGLYEGKVVWLKNATDKEGNTISDRKNPDSSLRNRPIMGIAILENIQYQDGVWKATIYSPKRGKRLPCTLSLTASDVLKIEVEIMGMTRDRRWTRVDI